LYQILNLTAQEVKLATVKSIFIHQNFYIFIDLSNCLTYPRYQRWT